MKEKILIGMVSMILLVGLVSASNPFTLCLEKNQVVEFSKCNPLMSDWTCRSNGFCQFCVFINDDGAYCPASINRCNALGSTCVFLGDEPVIDNSPPENVTHNIEQDGIYTERRFEFVGSASEIASWEYMNNEDRRPRFRRLCREEKNCESRASFDEGFNNITLKLTDLSGNEYFEEITFVVDSRNPRISKTEPRRGFADGNFEVQFREDNPEKLTLFYGDDSYKLNIEEDCYEERRGYACNTYVDLSKYDGEEIEYYFVLEDVAGNKDESRKQEIEIDTSFPVLLNEDYYEQGEGRYARYVYFEFEIEEENFDEVVYSYVDEWGRERERRLCSRLRDGVCEKKQSFRKGNYDLTIIIRDEAGNSIGFPLELNIDY